jgi:redox-sensing transcriptional repressor
MWRWAWRQGSFEPVRDPRRETPGDKPAPKAVVGRVSLYLRQLEKLHRQGDQTVSSQGLGSSLAIGDAQVRKDLAFFGQFGYPGIGYRIEELIPSLRRVLGIDHDWPLALIGLGNLGRALIKYRGFKDRGFHIVALFDNDPTKVGMDFDGLIVQPTSELAEVVAAKHITLAVLSVPADVAQHLADQLVACGVTGILNFAPMPLNVPPTVNVVGVDLSVQLEHLAYKVQNAQGGISYLG